MPRAPAVNGRNRHLATDTLGLRVAVAVAPADADDGASAPRVLGRLDPAAFPRLQVVFADRKYHNRSLYDGMREPGVGDRIEVASRPAGVTGFTLGPSGGWSVPRALATLAGLGRSRTLAKGYGASGTRDGGVERGMGEMERHTPHAAAAEAGL